VLTIYNGILYSYYMLDAKLNRKMIVYVKGKFLLFRI